MQQCTYIFSKVVGLHVYAAYRPNCYAIYVILSTNDSILVIVCHFCILCACASLLAKHMLRLNVASWIAMVSLELLPIVFKDKLLTCFSWFMGVREFYSWGEPERAHTGQTVSTVMFICIYVCLYVSYVIL